MSKRYEVRGSSVVATIAVVDTVAQEVCREWSGDTATNRSEAFAYCAELEELENWFNSQTHSAESFARLIRSTVN